MEKNKTAITQEVEKISFDTENKTLNLNLNLNLSLDFEKNQIKKLFSKNLNEIINVNEINNLIQETIHKNTITHKGTTEKIDYRNFKSYPIKEILPIQKIKNEPLFWLATYDKLIKTKNILKILNYYDREKYSTRPNYTGSNIKIKNLLIKNFDIFYIENSNKPYINYTPNNNNNFILVKLYLLTLKEINLVLNYLNRAKYNLSNNNLETLQQKGMFTKINFNNKQKINYPYNCICYLGKFMNTDIYSFTNINKIIKYKLPNITKLHKLMKILKNNFTDYPEEFLLNYLISNSKYQNSTHIKNEIKKIFEENNHNIPKKENEQQLKDVIRDTIYGIQTQLSSSKNSFINLYNDNELFVNSKIFDVSPDNNIQSDDNKINNNIKNSSAKNTVLPNFSINHNNYDKSFKKSSMSLKNESNIKTLRNLPELSNEESQNDLGANYITSNQILPVKFNDKIDNNKEVETLNCEANNIIEDIKKNMENKENNGDRINYTNIINKGKKEKEITKTSRKLNNKRNSVTVDIKSEFVTPRKNNYFKYYY